MQTALRKQNPCIILIGGSPLVGIYHWRRTPPPSLSTRFRLNNLRGAPPQSPPPYSQVFLLFSKKTKNKKAIAYHYYDLLLL